MGLIGPSDLTQMAADMAEVVGDRDESVVIRRGDATLAAQTVRIARSGGRGARRESDGAEETRGSVIVVGDTSFDVRPDDRFNDGNDVLYRVVLVRPNRDWVVVAEAEVVE